MQTMPDAPHPGKTFAESRRPQWPFARQYRINWGSRSGGDQAAAAE
jgi:hypothetical protein